MERLWAARRAGTQAAAPWVVAIVFLSVLATLVIAGRAAANGDLSLMALAIVGQSVLGMAGILFSFPQQERWLDEGSVAMPAVEEFEREAQSFRLSSGAREPGPLAGTDIRFANVSFNYPGTDIEVLSHLDLRIPVRPIAGDRWGQRCGQDDAHQAAVQTVRADGRPDRTG